MILAGAVLVIGLLVVLAWMTVDDLAANAAVTLVFCAVVLGLALWLRRESARR